MCSLLCTPILCGLYCYATLCLLWFSACNYYTILLERYIESNNWKSLGLELCYVVSDTIAFLQQCSTVPNQVSSSI